MRADRTLCLSKQSILVNKCNFNYSSLSVADPTTGTLKKCFHLRRSRVGRASYRTAACGPSVYTARMLMLARDMWFRPMHRRALRLSYDNVSRRSFDLVPTCRAIGAAAAAIEPFAGINFAVHHSASSIQPPARGDGQAPARRWIRQDRLTDAKLS
jgi:hypothetical protein